MEMLEDIIWSYGKPEEIITDNGEEFRSKDFQALLNRYDIIITARPLAIPKGS
jgi:transposase InsO family protein